MNKIYISHLADNKIKDYLCSLGYELVMIKPMADVDESIACHPDIYFCHLGEDCQNHATGNMSNGLFHGNPSKLKYDYPGHAIYNGCSTGKFFLHNLKITDEELLKAVDNIGLTKVHVPQGYAKCTCVVVDENSIITADLGIAKAATKVGLDVLIIQKAQVLLEGYPYGFLGGASGKVGNTILFNGDLSAHSDFDRIKNFIYSRGLNIKYFEEYPLTDIGSIIEEI